MTEESKKLMDSIEQLTSMLDSHLLKVRQTDDKVLLKKTYETVLTTFKHRSGFEKNKSWFILEQIEFKFKELFLKDLGDREEAEIDGYKVSNKLPNPRFALDSKKIRDAFSDLTDEEFKNKFYSYSDPKKQLTIK